MGRSNHGEGAGSAGFTVSQESSPKSVRVFQERLWDSKAASGASCLVPPTLTSEQGGSGRD